MIERSPYDGKPYYCAICRLGYGEYMACEEPDCILESEEKALLRMKNMESDDAHMKLTDINKIPGWLFWAAVGSALIFYIIIIMEH